MDSVDSAVEVPGLITAGESGLTTRFEGLTCEESVPYPKLTWTPISFRAGLGPNQMEPHVSV